MHEELQLAGSEGNCEHTKCHPQNLFEMQLLLYFSLCLSDLRLRGSRSYQKLSRKNIGIRLIYNTMHLPKGDGYTAIFFTNFGSHFWTYVCFPVRRSHSKMSSRLKEKYLLLEGKFYHYEITTH